MGGGGFAAPPGDAHRVFVVEQGSGTTALIRIVRDGATLPDPFLALTGVAHRHGEQGLLSMAFAPDYPTSGRFYVYYNDDGACTSDASDVRLDEFRRADADHLRDLAHGKAVQPFLKEQLLRGGRNAGA